MSPPFTLRSRRIVVLLCGTAAVVATVWLWPGRTVRDPSVAADATPPGRARGSAASHPAEKIDAVRDALAEALALRDPGARARAFSRSFAAWCASDPEAALAYLRRMPRGRESSSGLLVLLDMIARRDLPRALSLARELVHTTEEAQFYSVAFDRLARQSVQTAVEQVPLVPAGEGRLNAIRALLGVWTQTQFDAALAWAQQLPDPGEQAVAVESALGDLAGTNPLAAIDVARKSLRGSAFERTVSLALRRLAGTDPQAAAPLVALLRPGDEHTMAASVVARGLARQDVERAIAWVNTIPVDLTRWMVMNSVLTVWVQNDRDAAARYVLGIPPGYALDFAVRHVAPFLATEPRDAIAWAAALPTDSARASAYPMIASAWAQRAPADAVRWAAGLREDPPNAEALPAAFAYWELQDLRGARVWLQTAELAPAMKRRLLER